MINRLLKILLALILITSWLFSGWPRIASFPPNIQKADASIPATVYMSSTASAKITSTVSWQFVSSAPSSANTNTVTTYKKATGFLQAQPGATNSTFFGSSAPTSPDGKGWIYDTTVDGTVPAGTWVFNFKTTNSSTSGSPIGNISVCAWEVTVSGGAIASSTNIFACTNGSTNVLANTTSLFASSVSVSSVATTTFALNQYLYVEFYLDVTTAGGSNVANLTWQFNTSSEDLVLPGASTNAAPNAPSQDSPANNATGASTTPTFLVTATDSESDNLGYKVTIYSNSACSTVVQTDDQAVSSTGWTGTNATCTNNPTSCYTSGTQGNFLTQTALSNSTQYWWKASAKDPDGSGTFTNSSTCNTFTTVAAAPTVSCSTNIATTSFGTLTTSTVGTALPNASTTMSCSNTVAGCTLYVADAGNGASPGLSTSSPAYLISSATATLSAGTEGYGIQATTTAAGSGGTLILNSVYNKTGNNVGGLSLTNVALASSTIDISGREVVVTHQAAISATTQAGAFSDTITYSCTAN